MTDLQIANIRHALVALLDGGRVMSGPNTWQLNDDGSLCLLVTRRSCTGFDEVLLKNDLPFQQLCQMLANRRPKRMSATFGPLFEPPSPSAALQLSLENRLHQRMAAFGSPEYDLTWKHWGYVVGAADLCAAGVSAPHIRQRLYWVAYANSQRIRTERCGENDGTPRITEVEARQRERLRIDSRTTNSPDGLEQPDGERCGQCHPPGVAATPGHHTGSDSAPQRVDQPNHDGRHRTQAPEAIPQSDGPEQRVSLGDGSGLVNADGYHRQWWSGPLQVGWNCIEGEIERGGRTYRAQWRTKPGLSLLAAGVRGRVAQLCGFGNAIVPILAAQFILASEEAFNQTAQAQSTVLK
jgi:hypothetical protein